MPTAVFSSSSFQPRTWYTCRLFEKHLDLPSSLFRYHKVFVKFLPNWNLAFGRFKYFPGPRSLTLDYRKFIFFLSFILWGENCFFPDTVLAQFFGNKDCNVQPSLYLFSLGCVSFTIVCPLFGKFSKFP